MRFSDSLPMPPITIRTMAARINNKNSKISEFSPTKDLPLILFNIAIPSRIAKIERIAQGKINILPGDLFIGSQIQTMMPNIRILIIIMERLGSPKSHSESINI